MDILDGMIYFFITYVILVLLGIAGILILYPIYYFVIGQRPGFTFESFRKTYAFCTIDIPDWTKFIQFLITIFFLIMYIITIIIVTVVPPTGLLTLFIPFRDLLLSIPPLPQLRDKGVFNVIDRVFNVMSGDVKIETFRNKYINYLSSMKSNIYDIIKLFNPHLNMDKFAYIIENMQNNNKESEKRNVDNDIQMCIASKGNISTPDMNFIDLTKNSINDIKNQIKCNLNALPTYISTSE